MNISEAIEQQKQRKAAIIPGAFRQTKKPRRDYKGELKNAHKDAIDLALSRLRYQRNSVPQSCREGYQLAISRLEILRDE